MKGITFGNYHSYDDLHLILKSKEIGAPQVKTQKTNIEGADSALDLTEFFGEPKYEDVIHRFNFSTIVPQADFLSLFSTIKNALHGRKMRIILDDDPLFYWIGRLSVSKFTNEKNIGIISIEADCEPYKYLLNKTVVELTVNGEHVAQVPNSRKRVVPEVKVESASTIRIVYQGNIWDLGSGSYTLPELELAEGNNEIALTGTGAVTLTYQEAKL